MSAPGWNETISSATRATLSNTACRSAGVAALSHRIDNQLDVAGDIGRQTIRHRLPVPGIEHIAAIICTRTSGMMISSSERPNIDCGSSRFSQFCDRNSSESGAAISGALVASKAAGR